MIESNVHDDYDETVNAAGNCVTHNYVKFADGTQIEYGYVNAFKNGSDLKLQLKSVGWPLIFMTPYWTTQSIKIEYHESGEDRDNSMIKITSMDESTPIGDFISFNYLVIGRWK